MEEKSIEKNGKLINVLLIIIVILVIIGCVVGYLTFTKEPPKITEGGNSEIDKTPIFTMESYPKIDGSTSTRPLAEAFKADFVGIDKEKTNIKHSKTHNAYVNLINKNADIILVTYPSEEELKLAKENNVELEIIPIVKEALVFFVNKDNQVNGLTTEQIRNIYSGQITNWKDVGGTDGEIKAYQRPPNSGSQSGMLSLVMKETKMKEPVKETISETMADIIDVISDYKNGPTAIGYSYYYYATSMYTSDTIKLLDIDGVSPSYDNIKNGLYNLQTAYYAVIRKDEPEDSNARKLLKAMMSERGQTVAKEAGYVQNY